jgi:asparagine synthase (glutamine-hydrolysing)
MQAGIFSTDAAAVADFIKVVEAQALSTGAAKPRMVLFPQTHPRIAIAVEDRQHCPVVSASLPNGSFAVVAGELYNVDEIISTANRDHLSGSDAASKILDLYLASGPEVLAKINAAAIVTIWDADRHTLTIFRDRWGQKSQFYSENRKRLLWADDQQTLLALGVPPDIDADALDFFLAAGYFPAPWSGLVNVGKIPPAHALICRKVGTVELRCLWRGTGQPKLEMSPDDVTEHLQELLQQSLRRRYQPGSRTGVLLSGGVDSALLAGALVNLLDADIDTFTFNYRGYEGPFNENSLAQEAAKHFGTRHQAIDFAPEDLADNLDQMVLGYEEPFTYGLHSFLLKDVVKTGVSSIISGAGVGDWYAGRRDLFARRLRKLPLPHEAIERLLCPPLSSVHNRWAPLARNIFRGAASGLPNKTNSTVIPDALRSAIYQDPSRSGGRHRVRRALRAAVSHLAGESDQDQIALLTQKYFIAECNLYWYDRWARTWNVNITHPYYDNDLQEFAMRLERLDRDKPEMRRLAAKFMPHSMAYAPKLAHTVPIREWFRGPLLDLLRSRLSSSRLKQGGIFDPEGVQRLIDQHVNREGDFEWPLWTVLTTTVWQEVVLKTQPSPSWKEKWYDVLEHIHDAVIVWAMGGKGIIFWNHGAEKLYGYARDEVYGKVTHDLLKTRLTMDTAELESSIARDGKWTGELCHITRDGREVIVDARLVLLPEASGQPLVAEINRDISTSWKDKIPHKIGSVLPWVAPVIGMG